MSKQLFQLNLIKAASLLAVANLFFYSICFGDSTAITPMPSQTSPGLAGAVVPYVSCAGGQVNGNFGSNFPTSCAWKLGVNDQCLSAIGANCGSFFNANASTPYQMVVGASPGVPIVSDGLYEVMATFVIYQSSNTPVYYWVDDWAYNFDYANTQLNQHTRVFYSGDVPYVLNVGLNGAVYAVRFSGTVHLKAGSTVNFPRIWSDCTDPSSCGTFFFTSDWFSDCTNPTWYRNMSCFYITLLSYP